jgi:hypothetical protein
MLPYIGNNGNSLLQKILILGKIKEKKSICQPKKFIFL